MEQHKQTSGFLNGLMIGLAVGAGLTLLLTTKKGKKILKAFSEEGFDSITSLDDLYNRFEKAASAMKETPEEVMNQDLDESNEEYPRRKVLLASDAQTTAKLAEVQERLDQEIEAVSESVAKQYVAYADDSEEEEEKPIAKVKATRRRFFRGIPRRA